MDYRNRNLKPLTAENLPKEGERIVSGSGVVYTCNGYEGEYMYIGSPDLKTETFFPNDFIVERFFRLSRMPSSVGELKIGDIYRGENGYDYVVIGFDEYYAKVVNINTGSIVYDGKSNGIKYPNIKSATLI